MRQQETSSVPLPDAPTLSRSWAVQTAHVPIFTGGHMTHSSRCTTTTTTTTNDGLINPQQRKTPFLLLPVGGDVAVVDPHRGIPFGTVRGGGETMVDDDDGVDVDAITAYALSNNDQMILTCSHNSLLRQYAVNIMPMTTTTDPSQQNQPAIATVQRTKLWGKSGHTLPVTELSFHASDIFVATGSVDGSVRIWDVRGGYVTHHFRPQAAGYAGGGSGTLAVTALQWLPAMTATTTALQVAIGRDDGSIVIHDLRKELPIAVLRDHVSAVTCMEWSRDDLQFFCTAGRDAVVNLWRVSKIKTGHKKSKRTASDVKYVRVHTLPVYEQVEGMVILPATRQNDRDGIVVATAGSKGHIRIWKANTSDEKPRLTLIAEQPESQAFGEDRGGYLGLRFNPNGQSTSTTDSSENNEKSSSIQEQLIVADAEHNISFLAVKEGTKYALKIDRTIVGHNDDILDLKVIPSSTPSSRIVVATNSPRVRIFDLDDFSCRVLDLHSATVLCVDVSPCGRFIISSGKDKQMRVWDVNGRCVAVAVGHTESIGSAAFSRKVGRYEVRGKAARNGGGAFAVTASMDRTLKRWNLPGAADLTEAAVTAGKELSLTASVSVRAHDKDINIVSVAPNDSYIATGSQDKTAKLWKSADLSLVATLKGHRRGVWDCQFSPFDRVIATGSGDKTVKLWSLSDFSCVRTLQGHVASVLRVRFLSGGLQLVSSGADGLVKLWTIRTNECETTLDQHQDKVWALDLAANGKSLVSGGADSQLIVWQDTSKEVEAAKQAEEEEAILLDQKLANHLRHKEYGKALDISLARDKPHQTLKVLTSVIEDDLQKGKSGLESLKKYVRSWSVDPIIVRVLKYCREWNTRARNSPVALLTIKAIVSSFPADLLASTDEIPEILAGIVPYAERHFDRIDRLCANSYLLDYLLYSMGSIAGDDKDAENEFSEWQSNSRLVLPPTEIDGRTQVGGNAVVGRYNRATTLMSESDSDVVTIGESESSSDSSNDESDGGTD